MFDHVEVVHKAHLRGTSIIQYPTYPQFVFLGRGMKFLGMAKILQAPHLFSHDCVVCSFRTNLDSDDLATCAAKEVVPLYSVARYQFE